MRTGIACCILFVAVAAGCASNRAYEEGRDLVQSGKFEEGLAKIDDTARRHPENREYRQGYFRYREFALQRLWTQAEMLRQQSQWDGAQAAYARMLTLDAGNMRARGALDSLSVERRQRARLAEAEALLKKGDRGAADSIVKTILAESPGNRLAQAFLRRLEEDALQAASGPPQVGSTLKEVVTLDFRDATLKQVFEALARAADLNFVFDRDVRQDARVTIFVRNSTVEDVLRFVLVTNQLERKVLSPNTLLIYPNTTAKLHDYQDLVTKSFYLSNADAKTTANMIRALVKTKDLFVDEKLNLLVIRDTVDAVRMAERLVASQDLAEPEVMLEVEVLEVSVNKLLAMGIGWPNSLSVGLIGAAGTPGTLTLKEFRSGDSNLVRLSFTDPLFALNFRNQLDSSNLLANPRIRVKNKDKARVHIGDKVPVITTTTTATGFASESVTYLDVGLKLEVEPVISLDDEVSIKVLLEVSNIVREIRGANSSTLTYQVGTRNAATTLRLKDGETQILAGLISDEDRRTVNQIPGVGDLPIASRLFGDHRDTRNKTEIMLLMTPHLIRNVARPDPKVAEFMSGTEAAIGAPPLWLQTSAQKPTASAAAAPAPKPADARPSTTLALLAPPAVQAGEEFQLAVTLQSTEKVRGGLIDFAFDPKRFEFVKAEAGSLLASADKEAALRVSAPAGVGRLSVNFGAKGDVSGQGELVRLTLRAIAAPDSRSTVRLEAASFTTSTGQVISAPVPPALRLSAR